MNSKAPGVGHCAVLPAEKGHGAPHAFGRPPVLAGIGGRGTLNNSCVLLRGLSRGGPPGVLRTFRSVHSAIRNAVACRCPEECEALWPENPENAVGLEGLESLAHGLKFRFDSHTGTRLGFCFASLLAERQSTGKCWGRVKESEDQHPP